MLIHEHRGPLAADLHRYHGLRLATIQQSAFSLLEVADFAANLPHDGAVARAQYPEDWNHTADTILLRDIEHGIRVLAWQQTKDGRSRHPQKYPVPLPLTDAEAKAQKPGTEYDVCSIEEMNDFLGWPA